MVKSPPSNAGDAGSIPSQGTKIPHAMGQLSPHTATTKPKYHSEDPVQPKKKEAHFTSPQNRPPAQVWPMG